jgi:hypothetical protein
LVGGCSLGAKRGDWDVGVGGAECVERSVCNGSTGNGPVKNGGQDQDPAKESLRLGRLGLDPDDFWRWTCRCPRLGETSLCGYQQVSLMGPVVCLAIW